MTELEYLDRQEARTRRALQRAAGRMSSDLGRALHLERVAREYPALTLGAGVTAGVAGGWLLGRFVLRGRGCGGALADLVIGPVVKAVLPHRRDPFLKVLLAVLSDR